MNRLPLLGARVDGARGTRRFLVLCAALLLVTGCSAADATARGDAVARYEAALAPLKKRSDVLERQFAHVQGKYYRGPAPLRRVLHEIIPQYAELLGQAKRIEVQGPELKKAQALLIASLDRQQDGLVLALHGLEQDNEAKLARAGRVLEQAEALVVRHRRVLAEAARGERH